jgi:hypothetical protein
MRRGRPNTLPKGMSWTGYELGLGEARRQAQYQRALVGFTSGTRRGSPSSSQ